MNRVQYEIVRALALIIFIGAFSLFMWMICDTLYQSGVKKRYKDSLEIEVLKKKLRE